MPLASTAEILAGTRERVVLARPPGSRGVDTGRRPALDGVRAVAVLAVIAYHVGLPVPGGFLGVDVFFVLSGYLITRLLLTEEATSARIDLVAFWARRARRLLPALFVVIAVCAIVAHLTTPVTALAERRSDMLASTFYFANWHFLASDQSYFAGLTGASPLRHTWSLSIEEQFYLVWPLLFLLSRGVQHRPRPWLPVLVLCAGVVASGWAMAHAYSTSGLSRAYYGTDTRAQALLVGALLAMVMHVWPAVVTNAIWRRLAGWVGTVAGALVVLAFAVMFDQLPFYYRGGAGVFALMVAVVIWSVEALPEAASSRALSLRPLAWTGRISYGLYLWHWPLVVWFGESSGHLDSTAWLLPLELLLAFVLAALSYYLVERPIRLGRGAAVARSSVLLGVTTPVSLALVVTTVMTSTTVSSAQTAVVHELRDFSDVGCPPKSPTVAGARWCMKVRPSTLSAPVVIVAGDSTSRALDPGIVPAAQARGWGYVHAGQNGCSITGLVLANSTSARDVSAAELCHRAIPALVSALESRFPTAVWLVSDHVAQRPVRTASGGWLANTDPRHARVLAGAFDSFAAKVTSHGGRVVFLAVPPWAEPVDCILRHRSSRCDSPLYSTRNERERAINAELSLVARQYAGRAGVISVTDVLCPNVRCPVLVDGLLARYDGEHYTAAFSRRIAPVVADRLVATGLLTDRPSPGEVSGRAALSAR